jgi:hypothetical protein
LGLLVCAPTPAFPLVSISDLDYRTVLFPVRRPDLLFSSSFLVFFSRSRKELLIRVPGQGFGLLRFFRFPARFACQVIFFYFGFTVAWWEFPAPVFLFRAYPVPDFFLPRADFWCKSSITARVSWICCRFSSVRFWAPICFALFACSASGLRPHHGVEIGRRVSSSLL